MREDFALFGSIIDDLKPSVIVELGTGELGLTGLFADHCESGILFTFDLYRSYTESAFCAVQQKIKALQSDHQQVHFFREDVLWKPNPTVVDAIKKPRSFLFCDNGDKEKELALYAPYMAAGGIIGCHDWKNEVDPEWANLLMDRLGFEKHREKDCERLDGEFEYGTSRFWKKL